METKMGNLAKIHQIDAVREDIPDVRILQKAESYDIMIL